MKKFISILLCLVMIFSLSVPSFALESAEYYLQHIWDRFADVSYKIVDIDDNISSLFEVVSSLQYTSDIFYKSMFGDVVWGEPFGVVVQNALDKIVDSISSPEDLQLKEDTAENKQNIIQNFFSPDSPNSLKCDDIGELSSFVSSFKVFFNSSSIGSVSVFDLFVSDSEAFMWFTESTALAIDPSYVGGGGGGGDTPDPDNPDPDNPDPDNPDPDNPDPDNPDPDEPDPDEPDPDEPDPDEPDPDEPDPDEPDPEPIFVNLLPSSTTERGGSEIYNGMGYKYAYRLNNSGNPTSYPGVSVSGWISVDPSVSHIIYFYGCEFRQGPSAVSNALVLATDSSILDTFRSSDISNLDSNGVYSFEIPSGVQYFRFSSYGQMTNSMVGLDVYPSIPSTFSLRGSSRVSSTEVVTSFYQQRQNSFFSWFGGDS